MKVVEKEAKSILVGNWGNYVYAKINAIPLFELELAKLRRAGRAPSILLSSVTDAYQGAEKKYRLTRGILETLAREPYPGVAKQCYPGIPPRNSP